MTDLILVRHGESVWHAEDRYAGSSDIGLTAKGYHDADMLGHWARGANLDAIWCSNQIRAQATAAPSASVTGLSPVIDARLRELDFGQAEGHTRAELARQFADAFQAFQDNPVDHPLPGGEDPYQAVERTVACFHDIAQAYPDGKVLVVFHSTLLRLTMCKLLNIPLRHYRTIFPFIRNGALTELHLQGDQASLLMYNSPIEAHVALTRSDPNTARAVL